MLNKTECSNSSGRRVSVSVSVSLSLSLSLSGQAAVGQQTRPQVDASLLGSATVQSVLVVGVLLLSVCS